MHSWHHKTLRDSLDANFLHNQVNFNICRNGVCIQIEVHSDAALQLARAIQSEYGANEAEAKSPIGIKRKDEEERRIPRYPGDISHD